MNDPWDVKSVRQSGQYVSCMKINGVPLLPPVLSRECHKEMQYYKLLAKEVEKRISMLKPYVSESDTESSDRTDAPELPEYEQTYELPPEEIQAGFNVNIEKITAVTSDKISEPEPLNIFNRTTDLYNGVTSNVTVLNTLDCTTPVKTPKFMIDLSLSINETGRSVLETIKNTPQHTPPPIDLPERDYDCPKKHQQKDILTDVETINRGKQAKLIEEVVNFSICVNNDDLSKPELFPDLSLNQDGPSSLSSKSFTGSLNDIHTDTAKESQRLPKLIRQRSYTVLKPSPQLLAHLEVQSLSTGVDVASISMSESLCNIDSPYKKRRSWDLESAKAKWSTMALELKQNTNANNIKADGVVKNHVGRPATRKAPQTSPPRARSIVQERSRRGSVTPKSIPKSDPIQKPKKQLSPVRNIPSNRTIVKEPVTLKTSAQKKESVSEECDPPLISESDDPATRVRELYERIQKQQLIQMASLVEKQKREQMLLQQVFEEQNTLLYKQLKTICPKSPIEVKEAWGEKSQETDRGPVSLSQLISIKSPEHRMSDSPVSSTLTNTNNCLNQCNNVLKKSRDITSNIKKQQTNKQQLRSQNLNKTQSPRSQPDGSRTRTHSPSYRCSSASRRLNYDTSTSDREYDPILTDRTNDTMADLNVTFPSDQSDGCHSYNGAVVKNSLCKELTQVQKNSTIRSIGPGCTSTDSAIRCMEETIQNSINNMCARAAPCNKQNAFNYQPNAKQRAAATKIVAYAKGYLVRRLMRTERVQATVQTIRDALLCALQLHQDREGIRGADVDLHRRLIQQITAACYSLHDTFVASSPAARCALIAADRGRRRTLAARQTPTGAANQLRHTDVMSQSHSGSFPARAKRAPPPSLMTQSNYETFSGAKCGGGGARYPGHHGYPGCPASPRRRPWR